MAEQAVLRRKSQLFLTNISPVHNTYDELVRKKLKKGKFPQTKTGIIKMIGMSLQFSSLLSWVAISPQCNNWAVAYIFLTCTFLGFLGQFSLFMIFSFGKTVKDPGRWISMDIVYNLVISLLTIISASLSLQMCVNKGDMTQKLSEILSLSGASVIILSCVAILLMYRFVEDAEGENVPPPKSLTNQRKSIFA